MLKKILSFVPVWIQSLIYYTASCTFLLGSGIAVLLYWNQVMNRPLSTSRPVILAHHRASPSPPLGTLRSRCPLPRNPPCFALFRIASCTIQCSQTSRETQRETPKSTGGHQSGTWTMRMSR